MKTNQSQELSPCWNFPVRLMIKVRNHNGEGLINNGMALWDTIIEASISTGKGKKEGTQERKL